MNSRTNTIVAIGVFLVALLVYVLTLAPTVVFWDVGEFIAAAGMLQCTSSDHFGQFGPEAKRRFLAYSGV